MSTMTTKTPAKKWTPKAKDTGTFSVWLCLPMGMYAIAHRWPGSYDAEADPRDTMVRTRKAKYLSRLRASYLPELGPDEGLAGKGTDYGHRAFVRSEDLARAFARIALAIDASGFKDHCLDTDLHDSYISCWNALVRLEDAGPYAPKAAGQGWRHAPRPEDCERFGSHFWDNPQGSAVCKDCGCKRTRQASGRYRYNHRARIAVRLCDSYGKPLAKAA